MSVESKLKIESKPIFLTTIFYAIIGVIFLVALPIEDFQPQLAINGIFSLLTAYGMFKKRNWSIYFVFILFFTGTAFSAVMLYWYYLHAEYLMIAGMAAYLILTWVATIYLAIKRKNLEV